MTTMAAPQRTDGEDAIIQTRTVVNAVQMSMDSQDPQARAEAEAALRGWESDAAPGFLRALLDIARQTSSPSLNEHVRLLAIVLAKNAVGSSWRKTLGTREWSRIPDGEKDYVRQAAASLLLEEPQKRLATQTALLIANIARFDFPGRWPTLLADLTTTGLWDGDTANAQTVEYNDRALFTLKQVIRAVKSKRIVVETPTSSGGSVSTAELKPLADKIAQERKLLNTKAEEIFPILRQQWQQHFVAFMDNRPLGEIRGPLANRCLRVLRELMHMLADSWVQLEGEIREFLEGIYRATTAISTMAIGPDQELRFATSNKARVGMLQCIITALDRNPVEFAAFLPPFLALYSTNALTAPDAAGVAALPAKRRVLLTTFLARALVCPHYEASMIKFIKMKDRMPSAKHLEEANAALTQWLSPEHCGHLVSAVISKYIALTPEELDEWQSDPEGFIRSLDADTGPDADNPRACGVALLLCMLRKGSSHVAEAMLSYANHLQSQPLSTATLLDREACYRAIGEGFAHVGQHVDFTVWYTEELQGLLQQGYNEGQPEQRLLCARALWLIGVCGTDLPSQHWTSAYNTLVHYMSVYDLVIALTALGAILAMTAVVLEEVSAVEQAEEAVVQMQRQIQRMRNLHQQHQQRQQLQQGDQQDDHPLAGGGVDNGLEMWGLGGLIRSSMPWQQEHFLQEQEQDLQAAQQQQYGLMQDCQAHMGTVEAQAGAALTACFSLLGRVSEVDSMVRVLHLVTVMLEALGPKAQPHFHTITAALPKIWNAATQEGSSGPASRLHSALMAVLTHMVARLGSLAIQDPHIQGVLYALLQKGLEVSSAEQEVLIEDALKLLSAVLSASTSLAPALQQLIPDLMAILQRGKDNAAIFQVLEGFLVTADADLARAILQGHLPQIAPAVERSLGAVLTAAQTAHSGQDQQQPPSGMQPPHPPEHRRRAKHSARKDTGVDMDTMAEASAAASLLTVLLEVPLPTEMQSALQPLLRTCMLTIAATQPQGPMHLHGTADNLLEALSVVACTNSALIPALLADDAEAEGRLLDRWVALASTRNLDEILGLGTVGALQGRVKRHMAAAGLSTMLVCTKTSAIFATQRLARIMAVCLRALAESKAFAAEEAERRTVIADSNSHEPSQDLVKLRRISLSIQSIPRSLDLHAAVGTAAQRAVSVVGQETLSDAIGWIDSSFVQALRSVLRDAALVSEGDISEALKALSTKDNGTG